MSWVNRQKFWQIVGFWLIRTSFQPVWLLNMKFIMKSKLTTYDKHLQYCKCIGASFYSLFWKKLCNLSIFGHHLWLFNLKQFLRIPENHDPVLRNRRNLLHRSFPHLLWRGGGRHCEISSRSTDRQHSFSVIGTRAVPPGGFRLFRWRSRPIDWHQVLVSHSWCNFPEMRLFEKWK